MSGIQFCNLKDVTTFIEAQQECIRDLEQQIRDLSDRLRECEKRWEAAETGPIPAE